MPRGRIADPLLQAEIDRAGELLRKSLTLDELSDLLEAKTRQLCRERLSLGPLKDAATQLGGGTRVRLRDTATQVGGQVRTREAATQTEEAGVSRTLPQQPRARAASSECWNCWARGHRYADCPKPRDAGNFCFRCGKFAVTLATCPRCSQGWKREMDYVRVRPPQRK